MENAKMEKEAILEEVWRHNKKAEQTRTSHGIIEDGLKRANSVISIFIIVGSAVTAMFIFASIPENIEFWIGMLSASIFLVGLIPLATNLNEKLQKRSLAVKLWGQWIRDVQNFGNLEIQNLDSKQAVTKWRELHKEYQGIMDNTPNIPDRLFLKFKKRHKQKVEISKAIDKNPFLSIKELKKELRKSGTFEKSKFQKPRKHVTDE